MALVDSLLTAIIRADGDALVMHVGEKPYVVASAAPVELSTQGLNLEAMVGMLAQLLPDELQRALAEFGAVEHQLASTAAMDGDRFTVVAARGGDDVWIEIRRHRRPHAVASGTSEVLADKPTVDPGASEVRSHESAAGEDAVPPQFADVSSDNEPMAEQPTAGSWPANAVAAQAHAAYVVEEAVAHPLPAVAVTEEAVPEPLAVDPVAEEAASEEAAATQTPVIAIVEDAAAAQAAVVAVVEEAAAAQAAVASVVEEAALAQTAVASVVEDAAAAQAAVVAVVEEAATAQAAVVAVVQQAAATQTVSSSVEETAVEQSFAVSPAHQASSGQYVIGFRAPEARTDVPAGASVAAVPVAPLPTAPAPAALEAPAAPAAPATPVAPVAPEVPAAAAPAAPAAPATPATPIAPEVPAAAAPAAPATPVTPVTPAPPAPQTTTAAVIQMTRTVRIEVPPSQRPQPGLSHIERLLGIAAARGAAALYLTAQAAPAVRVEDDVRILEGEAALTSSEVEAAALELMPESARDALRHGEPTEWVSDLASVGRLRCSTFRDYRGSGAVFQLISVLTPDQLGLSPEIRTLGSETEGLVIVASPRRAGKSTLVGAFVDQVNRQRSAYVITLERQIRLVHDNRNALISQREVRGTTDEALKVARGALRENPDVLVIDDLPSADMFQLALEAAGSGVLVLATVTAGSTTAALTRMLELFPPDRRKAMQPLVADVFRGAVAQVLLRKPGSGRAVARELLLPTASVASILSDGQLSDLALAIDTGRKHGMTSLTDALLGLIRGGVVDMREAYRKADDRDALLDALKREKIDTSLVERLA